MHTRRDQPLRIALFPDTFYEPNGVATVSRQLTKFAQDRELPFFVVRGGEETRYVREGSLEVLELKRGPAAFPLDKGLYCDPLLTRHRELVAKHLAAFKPDLVHITGPGDLGFLGLWVAHMVQVPMAASWHTNLHEYLSRRLEYAFRMVPKKLRRRASGAVEGQSLRALLRFYRTAQFTFAPNQKLVDLLQAHTNRPSYLMAHGVDLSAYFPVANGKNGTHPFCIGYVGRLTTEKSVHFLVELERKLLAAGKRDYRFLIVGEGGQQKWLRTRLQQADIPGVLRGNDLAAAYRRMDAFVFPSQTDTFGLVILEAMASGVPVVLLPNAGRVVGVKDGISGCVSEDLSAGLQRLMGDRNLCLAMSGEARKHADANGWDAVFKRLYETYADGLEILAKRWALRALSKG